MPCPKVGVDLDNVQSRENRMINNDDKVVAGLVGRSEIRNLGGE